MDVRNVRDYDLIIMAVGIKEYLFGKRVCLFTSLVGVGLSGIESVNMIFLPSPPFQSRSSAEYLYDDL